MTVPEYLSASMSLGQFATKRCSLPRLDTSSMDCCSTVVKWLWSMRAKITQKISGEGDSPERNLAVKCSQGNNKRQDQEGTQGTPKTATTQTRQDKTTLGTPTPASQTKTRTRQTKTENYPGYPRSPQQRTRFKTGLFSKHRLWQSLTNKRG